MRPPGDRAPLSTGERLGVLVLLSLLALLVVFTLLFGIAACVALLRFIGWAI